MPTNSVSKNIKKFRNAKDISREDLAKTLNVTRQAISSWETGKTQPDLDTLMTISKALEVEMTELIYGQRQTGEYDISKKDRIRITIILIASLIVCIVLKNTLGNYLNRLRLDTFNPKPYIFFIMFINPLMYTIFGSFVLSIISIWENFQIKNDNARKFLLLLSAAVFWIYIIITILYYFNSLNDIIVLTFIWMINNTSIFIISGVCLFLGLNGGKESLKKTLISLLSVTLVVIVAFVLTIFRAYGGL